MNSIDIIKQELINQKTLLEQKGFTVNVANTNPSPTEITEAINNIEVNLTLANATVDDVALGKTFYAQSGELKTGTVDIERLKYLSDIATGVLDGTVDVEHLKYLSDLAIGLITGTGSHDLYIPTDSQYNEIKEYAYYCRTQTDLFHIHNLTFPSNITKIGSRAFIGPSITGTLTIPESVTSVGSYAFQYNTMTEVIVNSQNLDGTTHAFSYCPNLKKAYINGPIKTIPIYLLGFNDALEEVYLPATVTYFSNSALWKSPNLKLIMFRGETPFTLQNTTFTDCKTASLLVPYKSYDAYFNATNYQQYGNPMYGYGEFNEGDSLPSSIEGYTITWHTTLEDAQNNINAVTVCPTTGTMYGNFTVITE